MIELLKNAQQGDNVSANILIEEIQDNWMGRRIGRYLSKNRQVENDDIKQEFLIGVMNAIEVAKLDVGDPIEYILKMGVYAVRGFMRKRIVQATFQTCCDCGNKSRIHKVNGEYTCRQCGSTNIDTYEVNDGDQTAFDTISEEGFEDDVISDNLFKEFKETLTPGTNIYRLYEALESGIDRDNPAVKNYIKAIADEWGTSNENVVQNMKKLRIRLEKFMIENGMTPAI